MRLFENMSLDVRLDWMMGCDALCVIEILCVFILEKLS